MAYIGFGLFALALQVLLQFRSPEAPILPLVVRVAIGAAIAVASARRKGIERGAMLMSSVLTVLVTSPDIVGQSLLSRSAAVVTAIAVVWAGTRVPTERDVSMRSRFFLSVALVMGAFVIVYSW